MSRRSQHRRRKYLKQWGGKELQRPHFILDLGEIRYTVSLSVWHQNYLHREGMRYAKR